MMVTYKVKRILRYLGPVLFIIGLAYTAFYPERKLLQYKGKIFLDPNIHYTRTKTKFISGEEEKATTVFDAGLIKTVNEEIPLASCRVSFKLR